MLVSSISPELIPIFNNKRSNLFSFLNSKSNLAYLLIISIKISMVCWMVVVGFHTFGLKKLILEKYVWIIGSIGGSWYSITGGI